MMLLITVTAFLKEIAIASLISHKKVFSYKMD